MTSMHTNPTPPRNIAQSPSHRPCALYCNILHRATYSSATVRLLTGTSQQNTGSTFLSNVSGFPKEHCFLKPSRLCPFALLIRITRRWRRVWTIGGMKLTADNWSSRRKTFRSATLPIINLKLIGLGSNPVFLRDEHCRIIVEDPVRTAQ